MSGPITAPILGGPIEPSTSCHVCDIQDPEELLGLVGVLISEKHGEVILETVNQQLSAGDTVEWHAKAALEHKWSVQFLDDPLKSFIFNAAECGFKVINLPAGTYRYTATVEGAATSAQGSISIS
jgi:plastocyanin